MTGIGVGGYVHRESSPILRTLGHKHAPTIFSRSGENTRTNRIASTSILPAKQATHPLNYWLCQSATCDDPCQKVEVAWLCNDPHLCKAPYSMHRPALQANPHSTDYKLRRYLQKQFKISARIALFTSFLSHRSCPDSAYPKQGFPRQHRLKNHIQHTYWSFRCD